MSPKPTFILSITCSVQVAQDPANIFAFISDLRNDRLWRKEINKTIVDGDAVGLNTIVGEHSYLSKKVPDHVATLQCVQYVPNHLVVYQSVPESRFWLKNSRKLEPLANNRTNITYTVAFDVAVVKHGLGFGLPRFFLRYYTRTTMKRYLRKLKQLLEEQPTTQHR